ncbi:hypothetical protein VTH06DRAFT_5220, partial [Thermothelomyces fergusii]
MDQSDGQGIAGWGPWEQQAFGTFDQDAGAESYPNPDFLGGGAAINTPFPGDGSQGGLYRQFELYDQSTPWTDHPQANSAPFTQGHPLDQGFFGGEARQSVDGNQAIDGRFALDLPQGSGFPAQLHGNANQQIHPQFTAAANPQLQQQVAVQSPAQKAAPQQLPHQMYQQAIPRQQPAQPPVQQPTQEPLPQSAQRPLPQPAQQQFSPPVQQPVSQPVQQSLPQPAQQPLPQPAQQPLQNSNQSPVQQPAQRPALHSTIQASGGQHVFPQQPSTQPMATQPSSQPSETGQIAGLKRGATTEPQLTAAVAKKAKVAVSAAVALPSQQVQVQSQPASEPVCTINHQDDNLLSEAKDRSGAKWFGVPNLVVGPAPVKLQKGNPTKRYVTLSTKGGRDPLFSKHWRAWTPAESLGNHADAYQKAETDLDRQRADIRLDIEMNRGNSEIPVDWFKKGLKDRLGAEPKRLDPPAEPLYSGIKAAEYLRLHPAHLRNQKVMGDVCSDFAAFLQAKATSLKAALSAAAEKPSGETEAQALAGKAQLERAIEEGLRVEPENLFAKLSGNNKMIAVLNNILVKLINAGEANTSLAKAILRLNTRFTEVTLEQLEMLQMDRLRKKLVKEGDEEAKKLINQLYDNAKRNEREESDSANDSPNGES